MGFSNLSLHFFQTLPQYTKHSSDWMRCIWQCNGRMKFTTQNQPFRWINLPLQPAWTKEIAK